MDIQLITVFPRFDFRSAWRRAAACCAPLFVLAAALPAHAAPPMLVGSYLPAWSTEKGFRIKDLDSSGVAARFGYLNYAFENVYDMGDGTYRCDSGRDIEDRGDGGGMASSADYVDPVGADDAVAGAADAPGQPLAGNFNQIRELKQRHPGLKVLVALGGGSWSRWFSAGSATPELRSTLVASCISTFIEGNLKRFNGRGGAGSALGVFDGIDIDWEHPAIGDGSYNTVSPDDKHNFTLLAAEFRRQLDELSRRTGRRYYLSAAMNSTERYMAQTEPGEYARSLDWLNLMSYDFHGSWNKNGPADFQSNLYVDPANPDPHPQSVDSGVQRFIAAGVPPEKIVVGVPFYARGWEGVPDVNHGLYQKAERPAQGIELGIEKYGTIAKKPLPHFHDAASGQLWTYENGTFWTYDDPGVIRRKLDYVAQKKLGGIMSWSVDQDDAAFTLSRAMLGLD